MEILDEYARSYEIEKKILNLFVRPPMSLRIFIVVRRRNGRVWVCVEFVTWAIE